MSCQKCFYNAVVWNITSELTPKRNLISARFVRSVFFFFSFLFFFFFFCYCFSCRAHLIWHIKTYSKNKAYRCEFWQKCLWQLSHLNEHTRTSKWMWSINTWESNVVLPLHVKQTAKKYGSIVCEKTNFDLCPVPPPFVLTFCANTSQIFYKRTQTKENTFIVSQIPVLHSLHIYGQASWPRRLRVTKHFLQYFESFEINSIITKKVFIQT